jgi:hypothetical protein
MVNAVSHLAFNKVCQRDVGISPGRFGTNVDRRQCLEILLRALRRHRFLRQLVLRIGHFFSYALNLDWRPPNVEHRVI